MIYGAFSSFGDIQKAIEEKGIEIISSGFERMPQVTKKLTAEQEADVDKLLEKIEEDEDVLNVFHSMEPNATE